MYIWGIARTNRVRQSFRTSDKRSGAGSNIIRQQKHKKEDEESIPPPPIPEDGKRGKLINIFVWGIK